MLRDTIADDLKAAMKSKDPCRVATLRLILAALKDREIAARPKNGDTGTGDAEISDMLTKMIRQRRESIKLYESGGRLDLAEQEAREIEVIKAYLPPPLDDKEVEQAVRGVIAELGASCIKDMGRTMAALKAEYAGRMDFAKASGMVKEYLAGTR